MKGRFEHGEHGWFTPGERSYALLLKSKSVDLLAKSYPVTTRAGNLYQLKWFLEFGKVGPEEFLGLDEKEIKQLVKRACLEKNSRGHYASARRLFYVVNRFLELNEREVSFNRNERRILFKRVSKKSGRQYIPTREDIYRMVDAYPDKGNNQQLRGRAIILCLWQSGVRARCLCSWTYGMFQDKLWPQPEIPVPIKVVAYRERNVFDCAVDTKLSSYQVSYYYTFLHEEAAQALKNYLDARIKDGWSPKPKDRVFVTEGVASQGRHLKPSHLLEVVKNASKQIGIDPDSIWTHCFRKAFRKTLYRGGIDPDVAEAMMGHKLAASRGSYFDYHDIEFAKEQYLRGYWSPISENHIKELEKRVTKTLAYEKRIEELEQKNKELKQKLNGQRPEVQELRERVDKLTKLVEKQLAKKQG